MSKKFTTVTPFSKYLAMVLFILFPFVGFYLGIQYQKLISQKTVITNFIECKQAGNAITMSYPSQCRTPDGKQFIEEISQSPTVIPSGTVSSAPQKNNSSYWTPERMKSAKPN